MQQLLKAYMYLETYIMYGICDIKINLQVIHPLLPHVFFLAYSIPLFPLNNFFVVEENTKGADETVYHYIPRRGRPR